MNSSNSDFESRETKSFPWVSSFLGLGLIVSLSGGVYQHSQIERLGDEAATTRQEMAAMRETMARGEHGLKDALEGVKQEVASARGDAARGIQATRTAVAKVTKQQAEKHSAIAAELGTVKTAAEQAASLGAQLGTRLGEVSQEVGGVKNEVGGVKSEVGAVKTDVAQTRGDLERAVADLKRTTGDLGLLSGLVATNGKELAALRELGERDYLEFTINRDKTAQKLGEVMVTLKKTDLKRNRYTIEITADDKRVEKKDRTINEPVQFYVVSKARQPYELVVNQVKQNQVTGYLAVPKVKLARRG